MTARDPLAKFVVDQATRFVAPDGKLLLEDVRSGTAYIRFVQRKEPSCAMCVVSVDDLRAYLEELFAAKAPHIRSVDITLEQVA
jgi:hypothetical protein